MGEAKQLALDAVWAGGRASRDKIVETIEQVARDRETFTADDIWAALPEGTYVRERRVLGACLREAVKRGFCVATGTWERSTSEVRHNGPTMVWQSRLLLGRQHG